MHIEDPPLQNTHQLGLRRWWKLKMQPAQCAGCLKLDWLSCTKR